MAKPLAHVPGITRVANPYGISSAVQWRETPLESYEGIAWESLPCDELPDSMVVACPAPETDSQPVPVGMSTNTADFRRVQAFVGATPVGGCTPEELQARAEELLRLGFDRALEESLSESLFAGATAGGTLGAALVKLEEEAAKTSLGVGTVHLHRAAALYGLKNKWLETKSGRLYTLLGVPVVAGTGYPLNSVALTSALIGYRSDVYAYGTAPQDGFDRGNNDFVALAEQYAVIGYDTCGVKPLTFTMEV